MNNEFQRDQFALRYIWNTDNQGRIGKGPDNELTRYFYNIGRKMGVRGLDKNAFVADCQAEAFELVNRRWHRESEDPISGKTLEAVTDTNLMKIKIKKQIKRDSLLIASPYISPIQWSWNKLNRRATQLGVSNTEAIFASEFWDDDNDELGFEAFEAVGKLREPSESKVLRTEVGIIADAAFTGVLTSQEYEELMQMLEHGKSAEEVAEETKQNPATVRQRKKRSLEKLGKALLKQPEKRAALIDAFGFKDVD